MTYTLTDPHLGKKVFEFEVTKMATPSSSQKNAASSSDLVIVIERYQVRSGTCPVGNPSFTNLFNQVTFIEVDRGNFLLWQSFQS